MKTRRIRRLAILLLCIPSTTPALVGQTKARNKTVGACTRKAEFAELQKKIDPRIEALVAAPEDRRAEVGKAIADDFGLGGSIENLIRYRHPAMVHVFVPLLQAEDWAIAARALYGLKMTGDASCVPTIQPLLVHENARLRELAANAISHLAREKPEGLEEILAAEKDRYVRSSLKAAIAVLSKEEKPYSAWKENLTGPKDAPRVDWAWTVKGKHSFNKYDAKTLEYPRASGFDWPISWYEDSLFIPFPRSSFGGKSGHAGEDMAWFREGCSVYAVADGLVRLVQGAGGNWGFFVLIEHRLENGEYVCSVYGHLSFDLLVKPGDIVKRGQRIGTVGLSCSVENGGYGAHLHFGLANGPFRKPRGIYKDGSALNLTIAGKRVRAPVIGHVYLPDKPDKYGFPGLGLRAKLPDGKIITVNVGNVPISAQVDWIKGYAKRTRGWFDPYKYIQDHMTKSD